MCCFCWTNAAGGGRSSNSPFPSPSSAHDCSNCSTQLPFISSEMLASSLSTSPTSQPDLFPSSSAAAYCQHQPSLNTAAATQRALLQRLHLMHKGMFVRPSVCSCLLLGIKYTKFCSDSTFLLYDVSRVTFSDRVVYCLKFSTFVVHLTSFVN